MADTDERKRFEEWMAVERPSLLRHATTYADRADVYAMGIAWDTWRARAALDATPAEVMQAARIGAASRDKLAMSKNNDLQLSDSEIKFTHDRLNVYPLDQTILRFARAIEAMAAKPRDELVKELADALRKLLNEANAIAEMARQSSGNTNVQCLLTRCAEAHEVLAKVPHA